MSNTTKKLFLLDGFALIFRAHFSFITRPLKTSKGLDVSAITGFTNVLWSVLQKEKPTHIAVAFDLPGATFRNEMFTEYKANRDETPEAIKVAIPLIRQVIEAFNIPIISVENYEADDVVGTVAKQAEKEGFQVYMMTSDKDYAQLVSDNIFMYKPGRKGNDVEILDKAKVLEKWNIQRVDQVIDILGLQGDAVDNIPGIPGIGPKTAQKLLKKYDTIEGLIKHKNELKGKQKERVIEFADQAILSKKLATIELNVPIQFDAETYKVVDFNKEKLNELFTKFEFRTLKQRILGSTSNPNVQKDLFGQAVTAKKTEKPKSTIVATSFQTIEDTAHDYKFVNTAAERTALVEALSQQSSICFDTETTGVDPNEAELVGISFSWKAKKGYYVPVPKDRKEALAIVAEFKSILENPKIEKVGQNLKFDILMLKWYDVEVKGAYFDTMLAHYLLKPDLRHKLDYLAEILLNYKMVPIETLIGKRGKNQLTMRDIAPEKVSDYAAEDADITLQLKPKLQPDLVKEELLGLYNNLEMPLIDALVQMEYNGVRVNGDFLKAYSVELAKKVKIQETEIYETVGIKFNILSPKQVGEALFTRMKIPYRWRKTKSGQYSTNEAKLAELAEEHNIAKQILDYRKLKKLKSTYVDALPKLINPKTGLVHSSFNQARAATGRLSSENPNLQNIPIRDEAGREIRKAFVPRSEEYILLAADYSQIELRLIAEISKEKAMLEAFQKGQDIHRATAAKVYGVPFDEVTSDQRRAAKTVNFSILYGAGASNLSKQLNIKRTEAKVIIEEYFKQYSGLKKYMEKVVEDCQKNGYVKTIMGRKRYLPDVNSANGFVRTNAERVAINTPIQGSAADMIKVAMVKIHQALKAGSFKTKMIMQVHDELVFDVHRSELEVIKPMIENLMKTALPNLNVPILVGMDTGENWLEAH